MIIDCHKYAHISILTMKMNRKTDYNSLNCDLQDKYKRIEDIFLRRKVIMIAQSCHAIVECFALRWWNYFTILLKNSWHYLKISQQEQNFPPWKGYSCNYFVIPPWKQISRNSFAILAWKQTSWYNSWVNLIILPWDNSMIAAGAMMLIS